MIYKCPNCGSKFPDGVPRCLHCFWADGEELYKPPWMDQRIWEISVKYDWDPVKIKAAMPTARRSKKDNGWQGQSSFQTQN